MSKKLMRASVGSLLLVSWMAGAAAAAAPGPSVEPETTLWGSLRTWAVVLFQSATIDEGCGNPHDPCGSGESPEEGSGMDPNGG